MEENAKKIMKLLEKVSTRIKDEKRIAETTGCDFNIFTDRCFDERFMCDVLVKIINPKEHLYGKILCQKFMEDVLQVADVEILEINREDVENGRPIDIVLCSKNKNIVIPIEVKINAGDQPHQLYDYA